MQHVQGYTSVDMFDRKCRLALAGTPDTLLVVGSYSVSLRALSIE